MCGCVFFFFSSFHYNPWSACLCHNFLSLASLIFLHNCVMCNTCFCLFMHLCKETENCGCFNLCFYLLFSCTMTERGACSQSLCLIIHSSPPPLNTTVLLHHSLLTLSFCAFQLFICLHPAFASDTIGTEFWARKIQQRHCHFFFLLALLLCAWWWQSVLLFLSPCLTKLTLHFASCGHERHCRNTAVWGNGQVLKRSCCVCGWKHVFFFLCAHATGAWSAGKNLLV